MDEEPAIFLAEDAYDNDSNMFDDPPLLTDESVASYRSSHVAEPLDGSRG